MNYHVFNLTWKGPENKRTGGFVGVESVPRFFKDQATIITGPEAKLIAQRAHEENQVLIAEGKPAAFEIQLVSEPTDSDSGGFADLMLKLKGAPEKATTRRSVSK